MLNFAAEHEKGVLGEWRMNVVLRRRCWPHSRRCRPRIMPQWVQIMARLMFCDTSLISSPAFIWMRPTVRGCSAGRLLISHGWICTHIHSFCLSPRFALSHTTPVTDTVCVCFLLCLNALLCREILHAVLWSADSALVVSKLSLNTLGQILCWKICFLEREGELNWFALTCKA